MPKTYDNIIVGFFYRKADTDFRFKPKQSVSKFQTNSVTMFYFRLDLKNCSFAVTQPTQHWRSRLKMFYWSSKSKNMFLS